MPPQKAAGITSEALFRKLGKTLVEAHQEFAGKDFEYSSMGDLPGGISGGVAQLKDCTIKVVAEGKKNAGELMFFARGICVTPKEFAGQQTQGLGTSIMEMLCDTPDAGGARKTTKDHIGWVYNQLTGLGVNTDMVDPKNIMETLEALKATQPYFRFSTQLGKASEQYPNPRVFHNWEGWIPDYVPDSGDDMDDKTTGTPVSAPTSPVSKPAVSATKAASTPAKNGTPAPVTKPRVGPGAKPVPAPEPEVSPTEEDPFDPAVLDALLARVCDDEGDPLDGDDAEAAGIELTAIANTAGIDDDAIGALPSWAAVVEEIKGKSATDGEGEATPTKPVPTKGDTCFYAPPDKKDRTGKKRLKEHEVDVLGSDPVKETAHIKSMDDPKQEWKAAPWADLRYES